MADFPTLLHLRASERRIDAGVVSERAVDGTLRLRRLYAAEKTTFELVLGPLTSSELAELVAHYAGDRDNAFSYTWPEDSSTYTCRYASALRPVGDDTLTTWRVYVTLEGG
jgi:hypothetical protein